MQTRFECKKWELDQYNARYSRKYFVTEWQFCNFRLKFGLRGRLYYLSDVIIEESYNAMLRCIFKAKYMVLLFKFEEKKPRNRKIVKSKVKNLFFWDKILFVCRNGSIMSFWAINNNSRPKKMLHIDFAGFFNFFVTELLDFEGLYLWLGASE